MGASPQAKDGELSAEACEQKVCVERSVRGELDQINLVVAVGCEQAGRRLCSFNTVTQNPYGHSGF